MYTDIEKAQWYKARVKNKKLSPKQREHAVTRIRQLQLPLVSKTSTPVFNSIIGGNTGVFYKVGELVSRLTNKYTRFASKSGPEHQKRSLLYKNELEALQGIMIKKKLDLNNKIFLVNQTGKSLY